MNVISRLEDILKDRMMQYRLTLMAADFRYKRHTEDKYKLCVETDYHLNEIKKDIAVLQMSIDILKKHVDSYTAGLDIEAAPLIDNYDHEALMLEGCDNSKYAGWDDKMELEAR